MHRLMAVLVGGLEDAALFLGGLGMQVLELLEAVGFDGTERREEAQEA